MLRLPGFLDESTVGVSVGRRRRGALAVQGVGTLLAASVAVSGCSGSTGQSTPSASATSSIAPVASPAGVRNGPIAFDRNMGEGVYTINADGSEERLLFESHCCPDWSAGGRLVTPALTKTGLFTFATFDGDGSNYKVMENDDPTLHLACDTWSPDGTRVLCGGWDDTDAARNGVYSRRSSDGGDVRLITLTPGGRVAAGDYAPDGSRVAFLTESDASEGAGIFVANIDGTGLDQIIERANGQVMHGPTWSPDGEWILFDADDRLFLVHPDGTGRRDIPLDVTGRYSAYEAAWSPDGSRIVFSLFTPDNGQDDLFTAAVDGSELIQVTKTSDAQEGQPDWGPATP